MRRLITCFILALVSSIAFAQPQTKYSIKIIGEDFKPIPNVDIVSEVEGIGTVTDFEGCAVLLSGSYEDFNALKFIVSKKGYLSTNLKSDYVTNRWTDIPSRNIMLNFSYKFNRNGKH